MDVVVIEFDGEIADFPVLIQSVDSLIADGSHHLVIDLHTLPFINSAALGYLINARATLEKKKGELALSRVQPAIQNLLVMTGLDEVIPAFQTTAEAVTYLGGDMDSPKPPAGKRAVRKAPWRK